LTTVETRTWLAEQAKSIQGYIVDVDACPAETIDVSEAFEAATYDLAGYATLDPNHHDEIVFLRERILQYAEDETRRRPLCFLLYSQPGLGKSYLFKCLAKQARGRKLGAVSYNMATYEGHDDLISLAEDARNMKADDRLPLILLDEFDVLATAHSSFAMLLPILWNGELRLSRGNVRLGRSVIVLAGSSELVASMAGETETATEKVLDKYVDLMSRINGGIVTLTPFDKLPGGDPIRPVDKVVVVLSLLQQRFGDDVRRVPWPFLKLVASIGFRFGARSMAHLVDLIRPPAKRDTLLAANVGELLGVPNLISDLGLQRHLVATAEATSELWAKFSDDKGVVKF
jgi:hypothetical protein